jgi:hypothetical protein
MGQNITNTYAMTKSQNQYKWRGRRKGKDRRCIKFELVEAVNNSRNRKAPDLGSLLVELYEYGGSSVKLQILHSFITDCSITNWPNFRSMFYRTFGAKKKKIQ